MSHSVNSYPEHVNNMLMEIFQDSYRLVKFKLNPTLFVTCHVMNEFHFHVIVV